MKRRIIILVTFLAGLYYVLEFMLPPRIGGAPDADGVEAAALVEAAGQRYIAYTGIRTERSPIILRAGEDGSGSREVLIAPHFARHDDYRGARAPQFVAPDRLYYIGLGWDDRTPRVCLARLVGGRWRPEPKAVLRDGKPGEPDSSGIGWASVVERQEARGERQEARGKGQEARGERQEARGKGQEARGKGQEESDQLKRTLCEAALHVYERRLTDAAGGNFSVRYGDRIYCTPTCAGSKHWWRITPDMLIETDMEGRKLGGSGDFSREWLMHLRIYQEFPAVRAVVHAHAENIMVFAHLSRPIPPTSEQTDRWGTVCVCEEHASHTPELAEAVVNALRPQEAGLPGRVMSTLIPRHGIVIACADLHQGLEALEGFDQSCYILIARAALRAES
jgi:L-fuculose-phosphate aldolase